MDQFNEEKNIIEEEAVIPEETAERETENVKIAPDVVATIASVSASEIKGVAGMCSSFAGGIAEMLGAKKNTSKGIKVELKENTAVIDMYIIVEYGFKIPELARELQENVKNNVETMTGITVEKVNVHIDGISFKKAEEQKKAEQLEEIETSDEADAPTDSEIIVEEAELEDIPVENGEEENL